MTVINHKSISGITSITAPAGSDNLLTVHTNDTTERFRIVDSGAIVTGVTTASNFKTGTTNVHNVGVELAGINVLGADTPIGTGATIYNSGAAVFTGIVTAANLTVESKVGINSTSPTYALEVDGGTQNTVIALRSSDAKAAISFMDSTSGGYGRATIGGEGDQVYITSGNGTERIRFGTGGSNNTIGISTTANLVTGSEVLSVRGYSSFKSGNKDYAAIYTHNEGNTSGTYNAHILWNAGGANRGGIGYMPNNGEVIINNQNALIFATGGTHFSGTERLRITASGATEVKGDLYVKTTYPRIYLLDTNSNSDFSIINDNGKFSIYDDSNSAHRLYIKNDGKVGINTTSPARMLHIFSGNTGHPVVLERGDTSNTQIEIRAGGATRGYWGASNISNFMVYDNDASEVQFAVNQTGGVGIGINLPSAGDMASGNSQNDPLFHVKASDVYNTSGEYNLLGRFQAGSDADDTGAMVVLNHDNDRGLAIIGGRSVGNRAYGALKSIDNIGRISDAIEIRGGNGEGVAHLAFYTGEVTTTTQRLHITSGGHILTQSLTGTSFNNDGNNVKILEVTGDGTVGEYGQINISGNQNANAGTVGIIKFINRENSASSSGSNAASRQLGSIEMRTHTGDSNAGDDSGGYFRFILKEEGGGNGEVFRINNDGNVGIDQSNPLYKLDVYKGNLRLLTEGGGWSENGESYPTIFLSANYAAASDPAHGKISVRHSNQNSYSGDLVFMPQGYYDGSYGYPEVLRVSAYKRVGINESNPDRTLHISDASNGGVIRLTNTLTSINNGTICGMIEFEQRDSNTPGVSANIRAEMTDTSNGANQLCFSTGTPSTIGTRMTLSHQGRLSLSGPSSQQLNINGTEADIWLNSSGSSLTTWRILGSTGGSTHRFRIYDETNSRDVLNIYGQNTSNETRVGNSDVHINYGLMIGKNRTRYSTSYGCNDVYAPVVSGGEGECVFSIDPSWSQSELRKFFNSDGVSWLNIGDAPGGYAIMVSGAVNIGGDYGSGFPYIPIDDGDSFRMECWMRTHNGSQNHYMGSIEYDCNMEHGTGNPGSYGYWCMVNQTINSTSWTRVNGTLGPSHGSGYGQFRSGFTGGARKYWTPQALFNYVNNSGDRICYISGWRVFRLRHRGTHVFEGLNVTGSKTFQIPHPLTSKKDTHELVHSSVESPQCDNIYRGKITLSSGTATVNLDNNSNMTDGTFVALNTNIQCHTSNETGWGAVKGSVSGNILTITAQDNTSTDTISWIVVGERKDEQIKTDDRTNDDGELIVELPKVQNVPEGGDTPMVAPEPST